MKPAIRVENLSKQYRIGARTRAASRNLTESIADGASAFWRAVTGRARRDGTADEFWALKDVSFDVQPGQVVGIIGRNGAGKSTLLKILSRTAEPTRGRAQVRGEMASLLEVGTGFHPELTGRENVYLNGSILGMSREQITTRFDDIVAFAGIPSFIDTPVKRYSSGMSVRLAFAVAAFLQPPILVVDEVLAVGDADFQAKCLGKLSAVAAGGRTVLFVSHNMAAVGSLCDRVIQLQQGRVVFDGPAALGIERYAFTSAAATKVDFTHTRSNRHGRRERARLKGIALLNKDCLPCARFYMGQPLTLELQVECTQPVRSAEIGFSINNALGICIHIFVSTWEGLRQDLTPGMHRFRATVPQLMLYPGAYSVTTWIKGSGLPIDDQIDSAISFNVMEADVTGHRPAFENYTHSRCEVYCPSRWTATP